MGEHSGFSLTLPAIRGIQAAREYYATMCPLKFIPGLFRYDDDGLPAELRVQRRLNKARIPDLVRYMGENPREYVFSSLTASIAGEVAFKPIDATGHARNIGSLTVPMNASFLINDGQHRRAAIEEALKEWPELAEETISVVLFVDAGLKRSQQMFSDLNKHAIRPTKSLRILYDFRDPLSRLACDLADSVPIFKGMTETEHTTISNRSRKLFTLSSIYQATTRLLRKRPREPITEQDRNLARDFWIEVSRYFPDWQRAADGKLSSAELRRDFIHAHGIALQALAIAGADLIGGPPGRWKPAIKPLKKIDWSRSNAALWEGRATVGGHVSKAHNHVTLTANAVKKVLSLPLSVEEQKVEERHGQGTNTRRPHPVAD